MKKVLVIGAGAQGGPCASILSRQEDVSEIVLGDIDVGLATKVKDKIKSNKVTAMKLDASRTEEIEKAARGADVIINLVPLDFNVNIMQVALSSGIPYVDAASWNDVFEVDSKFEKTDSEFKQAGLTAFTNCGATPGITNVMARYACDKLDSVTEIRIRVGGKALQKPKEVVRGWEPTWSPETALTDFGLEPTVFENGKYNYPPPFSGPEEYKFPEPVGPVLVTHHTHEEPATLPRFIGKGIKYCDFKYPIDPIAGSLVKMGFASYEPIEVKGVKVAPIHVVLKLVRHPVNTFLNETEETVKRPAGAFFLVAEVAGAKSGDPVTYKIWMSPMTVEERLQIFRRLGTAQIFIALPAAIAAKMCVNGETPKGLISPECVDPVRFLEISASIGAPLRFMEVSSKEVSIS